MHLLMILYGKKPYISSKQRLSQLFFCNTMLPVVLASKGSLDAGRGETLGTPFRYSLSATIIAESQTAKRKPENSRVTGSVPVFGTFEIKGFAVFCEAFFITFV